MILLLKVINVQFTTCFLGYDLIFYFSDISFRCSHTRTVPAMSQHPPPVIQMKREFRAGKSLMHAVRAVAENHKPSLSGPSSTLFLLLHGPFFPIRAHAEVLQGRKFQKNSQSSVNDEPSLSASEPSTEGVRNF